MRSDFGVTFKGVGVRGVALTYGFFDDVLAVILFAFRLRSLLFTPLRENDALLTEGVPSPMKRLREAGVDVSKSVLEVGVLRKADGEKVSS